MTTKEISSPKTFGVRTCDIDTLERQLKIQSHKIKSLDMDLRSAKLLYNKLAKQLAEAKDV